MVVFQSGKWVVFSRFSKAKWEDFRVCLGLRFVKISIIFNFFWKQNVSNEDEDNEERCGAWFITFCPALTLHKRFLCGLCVSYLNAIVCFIFLCRLSLVDISRQTLPEDTSEIEGPKSVWSFRLLLKIVNTAVIETVRSLLLVHLSPSKLFVMLLWCCDLVYEQSLKGVEHYGTWAVELLLSFQ